MTPPPKPSRLSTLRKMRETVAAMTEEQIDAVAYVTHGIVTGEFAWKKADLLRWYDDSISAGVARGED